MRDSCSRYAATNSGESGVRQSLRHAKRAGRPGWAGRAAFRTVLRATANVPPLRRAMGPLARHMNHFRSDQQKFGNNREKL